MSRRNIPSLLDPYLHFPAELSLTLLTSTLGSSTTWLTTRFIGSSVAEDHFPSGGQATGSKTCVVLVSWIRDAEFWKTELKRTVGLDGSRLSLAHRFICIDALSSPQKLPGIIQSISTAIQKVLQYHQNTGEDEVRILLILDSPDVCLATASTTTSELNALLLSLRRQVWATVVTCSAGLPLLSAADTAPESRPTPIETESAAFVTSQVHAADVVMSVRELDTGAARDVSGVLRVSRGGSAYEVDVAGGGSDRIKGTEMLYLVQRDGYVKVFARGSDAQT